MEEPKTGLISMILGIASIVLGCVGIIPLPIAAIVLANITKNNVGEYTPKAKVGLITGIIGAVICAIACIVYFCFGGLIGLASSGY